MEYASLILSLIIGGLYRRAKGGWLNFNSTLLRIVGFAIPLTICFLLSFSIVLSFSISSFATLCWLMPNHGYGMSMGRFKDHTLVKCILVMSLQYGGTTTISGLIWEYLKPNSGGLIYCLFGFIVPIGYYVSNELWDRFNPKKNDFIDGACAYGEIILGASILGGIQLSNIISSFC